MIASLLMSINLSISPPFCPYYTRLMLDMMLLCVCDTAVEVKGTQPAAACNKKQKTLTESNSDYERWIKFTFSSFAFFFFIYVQIMLYMLLYVISTNVLVGSCQRVHTRVFPPEKRKKKCSAANQANSQHVKLSLSCSALSTHASAHIWYVRYVSRFLMRKQNRVHA